VWVPLDHTPIIIDTDGSGFHLTSAAQGIKWDFFGDGRLFQIAWTEAGVIDRRDAVFAKLLIWIDSNHDGISQPKELHHLKEMGIQFGFA